MRAAKDALIDIRPDILCLQEVRDWDSVEELVSMLPGFQDLRSERFRCYSDRCLVFRLLCKPLTKIILTSQVALKQRRRKNMLRALEFPECPDFPE